MTLSRKTTVIMLIVLGLAIVAIAGPALAATALPDDQATGSLPCGATAPGAGCQGPAGDGSTVVPGSGCGMVGQGAAGGGGCQGPGSGGCWQQTPQGDDTSL